MPDSSSEENHPSLGGYSVSPFLKQEVSDQIRRRDPHARVSWNWYDTWQEEHHRAFVVAKMCKADLLQEVHDSLQKAVDTGMTFEEWKKDIVPKLEGKWLGRTYGDIWVNDLGRDIEDLPEKQRGKIIAPKRLETIYRTNMKVAHAAGQYESLMDMADLYPYWRYNTQEDERVRKGHAALNNKVFRHDDPFWDTHYPPNGWNCRCYVRAMDEDDLEDEGLTVTDSRKLKTVTEASAGDHTKLAYIIDGNTVSTADGWNYNPGKVLVQVTAMAKKKVDKYDPQLRVEVQKEIKKKIDSEEAREAKQQKVRHHQSVSATPAAPSVTSASVSQPQTVHTTPPQSVSASKEHLTFAKMLRSTLNFLFGSDFIDNTKSFTKNLVRQVNQTMDALGEAIMGPQLVPAYAGDGGFSWQKQIATGHVRQALGEHKNDRQAKPVLYNAGPDHSTNKINSSVQSNVDNNTKPKTSTSLLNKNKEILHLQTEYDQRIRLLAKSLASNRQLKESEIIEFGKHLLTAEIGRNRDGIKGCHLWSAFKSLMNGVVADTIGVPVPNSSIAGVSQVAYHMRKKGIDGNVLSEKQHNGRELQKTVFDDEECKMEEFISRAFEAVENWRKNNPGCVLLHNFQSYDNAGVVWQCFSYDDRLTTAFPV